MADRLEKTGRSRFQCSVTGLFQCGVYNWTIAGTGMKGFNVKSAGHPHSGVPGFWTGLV